MKMLWRNNSLSIVLGALFLLTLIGQTWSGWLTFNAEELTHDQNPIALSAYLLSGHFWEATGENWESEFLQMAMFVILTCFLHQKGSTESKRIDVVEGVDLDPRRFADDPLAPWPVRRGGWPLRFYERSLGTAFIVLFVVSFIIHAWGGLVEFNGEQLAHAQPAMSLARFMTSSRFWFESFQNWQSEFLSLLAMVLGTIALRHRGSAESKPVHVAHSETGR